MELTVGFLRVGKIVNTQGIRGDVRVIPLTDYINRFGDLKYVYLNDEKLIKQEIESVSYHKSFVLLKFRGIDSMSDAEKLKDNYILVDRRNAVKLPEGRYFICDLIGLKVYDIGGGSLGEIVDVISTGSNDVYVTRMDDREILIPALKTVVMDINIEEGRMTVHLPEGLI